jgi:predicted phosphoribosyltransferase
MGMAPGLFSEEHVKPARSFVRKERAVWMRDGISAFADRADAGRQLAREIELRHYPSPIVLALPRGGVAVGYEISHRLHAPLDVIVARKIGAPEQPELAIGAIAPGGVAVVDESALHYLDISRAEVDELVKRESIEMWRRDELYRGDAAPPDLRERTVILVDDGLATGMTAQAAILSVRERSPQRLVLAIPVCARETGARLEPLVDEIVCLQTPHEFHAVGIWYQDFTQLSDEQVITLLTRARIDSEHMVTHRGPA